MFPRSVINKNMPLKHRCSILFFKNQPLHMTYSIHRNIFFPCFLLYVSLTIRNHQEILLPFSMEQSSSWEANRFSSSPEIPQSLWNPKIYGTQRYITAFTSASDLSLSWARSIPSMSPHSTSWRSVLILSYHLHQGLLSGLFPSSFPTKTLYTPLLSPYVLHAPSISFFSI